MLFLMKNIKLHQNISTLVAFFVQALEKANDVPLDLTSISRDFDRVSHPVQLILRLTQTAFPAFLHPSRHHLFPLLHHLLHNLSFLALPLSSG
jgi:hypothetical protein